MRKKLALVTITVAALAAALFTPAGVKPFGDTSARASAAVSTPAGQRPAEKAGPVAPARPLPRSVKVGTTDLRTKNQRAVTDWRRLGEVDGTTAHRVNVALSRLPPAPGTTACTQQIGDGWWVVSCVKNNCIVTISGSAGGGGGVATNCGD